MWLAGQTKKKKKSAGTEIEKASSFKEVFFKEDPH